MKVKAIIMRPDRTNDVIVLKKKQLAGRVFTHDGSTYFIDPDHQQVTWTNPFRLGLFKKYYSTYYYKRGVANPLPVPNFESLIGRTQKVTVGSVVGVNQNGNGTVTLSEKLKAETILVADFKDVVNLGVSEEEMAAIFNPWFYRTIAPTTMSMWDQIQLYATIGTALGVGYLIYLMSKVVEKLGV